MPSRNARSAANWVRNEVLREVNDRKIELRDYRVTPAMLGRRIEDPEGVEGERGGGADGLGLLDVTTTFGADKVLDLPTGTALGACASMSYSRPR